MPYAKKTMNLQNESSKYNNEVVSRLSVLGQMLGSITHEINNPLTVILGTAKYFKMIIDKKEMNEDLVLKGAEKIMEATNRVAKIIKTVKSFTRETSNEPLIPVKISDIFNEVNSFIGARVRNHGIQWQIESVDESVVVKGSAVDLNLALISLIMHCDECIKKKKDPKIHLSCISENHRVTLKILGTFDSPQSEKGIEANSVAELPAVELNSLVILREMALSVAEQIVVHHNGEFHLKKSKDEFLFLIHLPS